MMKHNFFDIRNRSEMPFQIFIGGRGIGKTFSALTEISELAENEKFLFLRRQATEIEKLCTDIANPFKAINRVNNRNISVNFNAKLGLGIFSENEKNIGYCGALSTFYGLRGIDVEEVVTILFDEFIPEKLARPIKDEGLAFLNLYETVNRNRELLGKPPVKVYFLANSISLNNPILAELGVINVIHSMIMNGKNRYTDKNRGLYIEYITNSPISAEKEATALYKLSGTDSRFNEQALKNRFDDDTRQVKKVDLKQFKPLFVYGNCTLYQHKSEAMFHAVMRSVPAQYYFKEYETARLRLLFAPKYRMIIASNACTYDSYSTKIYLDNALL